MANKKDLANGLIGTALTSAATTLVLQAGYGASMPAVPFFLTITPAGQLSTRGNSEIVNVTARTGDTLTIERAQKETTARAFSVGDVVSNSIYTENSTVVGDIFMSMRATPAAGRLFMDGGTYSKADWPILYKLVQDNTAYGTTGGTVGAETFTLADFRERMPFGKSQSGSFSTLGYKMGTQNETLTVGQIPSHAHTQRAYFASSFTGGAPDLPIYYGRSGAGLNNSYDNINATGGGGSHNNMPPVIVVNYEVVAS